MCTPALAQVRDSLIHERGQHLMAEEPGCRNLCIFHAFIIQTNGKSWQGAQQAHEFPQALLACVSLNLHESGPAAGQKALHASSCYKAGSVITPFSALGSFQQAHQMTLQVGLNLEGTSDIPS